MSVNPSFREKSAAFHTLGCKLNYSETSTLSSKFYQKGFKIKAYGKDADIFVLNTCSVTENADKECRQIIRSVLNKNPETYVIVTGCYAQLQPDEIASIKGVDLVLGAKEKFNVMDYIENYSKMSQACVFTSPVNDITDFEYAYSSETDSRTRAFLKIQDGCSYNCSFCTIPLARGKSRSQNIEEVILNAQKLIDTGYKEIILTGVNTGDYEYQKSKLIDVLYELEKLDIFRIRISSIEPNLLNDEIIQLVKSSEKFCRHFHIPMQSGDKDILKLMRRRYNSGMYSELVHKLKREIPDVCIGADVIVGFPGETDKSFESTFDFIDELPVSYLHVFSYSERRDTDAVKLPGRVDIMKRKDRSRILRKLSVKKRNEFYSLFSGKVRNVLFESIKEDGYIYGFTDNYIKVKMREEAELENKILPVKLLHNQGDEVCEGYYKTVKIV